MIKIETANGTLEIPHNEMIKISEFGTSGEFLGFVQLTATRMIFQLKSTNSFHPRRVEHRQEGPSSFGMTLEEAKSTGLPMGSIEWKEKAESIPVQERKQLADCGSPNQVHFESGNQSISVKPNERVSIHDTNGRTTVVCAQNVVKAVNQFVEQTTLMATYQKSDPQPSLPDQKDS